MKALITFTASAELDMSIPLFPHELDTNEKKLAYWLQGANEDALNALIAVEAVLKVTGELKGVA